MAASKCYKPNYSRYLLPNDNNYIKTHPTNDSSSSTIEFDESEVWSSAASPAAPREFRRQGQAKKSPQPSSVGGGGGGSASSFPVNVPDWSKILKSEYRNSSFYHHNNGWDDDVDEEDGGGDWLPPHEFLARTRVASSSVHEGVGRTLKGRDLSRVRNAIWQKTGFQD